MLPIRIEKVENREWFCDKGAGRSKQEVIPYL
jgi:hypothetical protein